MDNQPKPGEQYRHYKGGRYVVLHIAKDSNYREPTVVYLSLDYGTIWTRAVFEWNELVTVPGKPGVRVPRFQREASNG